MYVSLCKVCLCLCGVLCYVTGLANSIVVIVEWTNIVSALFGQLFIQQSKGGCRHIVLLARRHTHATKGLMGVREVSQ